MRIEVERLVDLGPLPGRESDISLIERWEAALHEIASPVSDEESIALLGLLPVEDDDGFGMAWTLLHLIESAPRWPIHEYIRDLQIPWGLRLRDRSEGR